MEGKQVNRAVVIVDNGYVSGVVVNSPDVQVTVLDCGFHVDYEREAICGESLSLWSHTEADENLIADRPFVERVFGAVGTMHPIHIRFDQRYWVSRYMRHEESSEPYLTVMDFGNVCEMDTRRMSGTAGIVELWHDFDRGQEEESVAILFFDAADRFMVVSLDRRSLEESELAVPSHALRIALRHYAKQFAIVHNHPGEIVPQPSASDIETTRRLVRAAQGVGVSLRDHVIIGGDQGSVPYSFREHGMLGLGAEVSPLPANATH